MLSLYSRALRTLDRDIVGRALSDVVTVPLVVGQKLAQPALVVGHALFRRVPWETLIALRPEHQRAQSRVVYDFFSGLAPEIAHPGGSLPGANRWDEPLDPAHPVPVILVHGTGGGAQTNWGTYVPLLTEAGYSVFTLTYGAVRHANWPISALGGMRRLEVSAAEVGDFVEKVLAATGAEQVDVVGHSQGTLIPNYWARFLGGDGKIRKYISLAPLWQGSAALDGTKHAMATLRDRLGVDPSLVVPCESLPQMMDGSAFIEQMNSGGHPYLPDIEYTNISTLHDELVRPYTSGQVPGPPGYRVHNIVVQHGCTKDLSDHLGICGSRRAAAFVLNALDDQPDRVVPCDLVAPFFGSSLGGRNGGAPELIKPFVAAPWHSDDDS
ncbi:esterase/lipase family protein [Gordonia phosphorivorans]|uniref:Esterase/lipase family protein n=1 Tax=Gordonia phosphorivorans TaxID=1056982 RepID=A0ABV6H4R2_9ACTN